MLIALIVTIAAIRVKRADLAGGHPAASRPGRSERRALEEQRNEKSRDVPAGRRSWAHRCRRQPATAQRRNP